jgi:tetrahydrodipicolinate N-succinyltransferase
VAEQGEAARPRETLSAKKNQFIVESVKLHVPEKYQQHYLKLLLHNHEAVCQDKFNLGRTDTLLHKIALKTDETIYIKQFRIPDAHQKEVERHVLEWLKLESFSQPATTTTAQFSLS